jgi:GNAT superfamily N-acetyltransferase
LSEIRVRAFCPSDQERARALILDGMREHWGSDFDPSFNRDIDDIAVAFARDVFVVAELDGVVAGTGALKMRSEATGEVVRMSVSADRRRRGIATAVLEQLIDEARARGCRRAVLATNLSWVDARAFYAAAGFREIARTDVGVVFERLV